MHISTCPAHFPGRVTSRTLSRNTHLPPSRDPSILVIGIPSYTYIDTWFRTASLKEFTNSYLFCGFTSGNLFETTFWKYKTGNPKTPSLLPRAMKG